MNASERQTTRYAVDPVYRMVKRLRSMLTYRLRSNYVGAYSTELLDSLGVSVEATRKHLESQFKNGMTWSNYGTVWEVDHIVPLNTAETVEDVWLLFHYMNLQPISPQLNKSSRQRNLEEKSVINM